MSAEWSFPALSFATTYIPTSTRWQCENFTSFALEFRTHNSAFTSPPMRASPVTRMPALSPFISSPHGGIGQDSSASGTPLFG